MDIQILNIAIALTDHSIAAETNEEIMDRLDQLDQKHIDKED